MDSREAAGVVIGLPVNMDGTEGPRCQSVRAFGRHLMRLKDLPIAFWDERLSSAAVNRMLIGEADVTRARRADLVDKACRRLDPAGRLGSHEELMTPDRRELIAGIATLAALPASALARFPPTSALSCAPWRRPSPGAWASTRCVRMAA